MSLFVHRAARILLIVVAVFLFVKGLGWVMTAWLKGGPILWA